MNKLFLQQASKLLFPLLMILSLILLYRGHNLPGGGFIGGLAAASAFVLYALAHTFEEAERILRINPLFLIVAGLSLALLSTMPGLFMDGIPMKGQWLPAAQVPLLGKLKLGTPLLFDVGVYLTVIGFTLKSAFAMGGEQA